MAKKYNRSALRITLLATSIVSSAAYAQADGTSANASKSNAQEASPDYSNDIIVTAQKRSESVNTVPMSVTALTAGQLASSGVNNTADLAKIVPGFSAVTSYNNTPVYYLRGVGYYDTSIAARPAVTIYSDEAPIPYSVMAMGTTLDLERVEVLKGPQGTLFGSNSTGGAINFIAAKPTDSLAAGADISFGRFNDLITSGFVSGPITEGLTARLAVSHESASDWQQNYITGQTIGAKNISSFRATVKAELSDRLSTILTVSGTHDGSDVQVGQLVGKNTALPLTPNVAAFPLAPKNARSTAFGSIYGNNAQLKKDNNELQVTLRVNYDLNDDITITSLSSGARNTQSYAQNAGATTLRLTALDMVGKVTSFSQELRAAGTVGAGRWIFGGNFETNKTSETTTYDLTENTSGNVFGFLGLPAIDKVPNHLNTKYKSYGVFGNLDYDLGDTLTVHAGARYTKTDLSYRSCVDADGNLTYAIGIVGILNATGSNIAPIQRGQCFVFTPVGPNAFDATVATGKLNQDSVSWRAGLDWKPVKGTLVYGSVTRGFKGAAVSNVAAVFTDQYTPVPQEKLTAYEVGIKSDIFARTHINAALFYYEYKGKQLQGVSIQPVFGALTTLVSIPKSHIEGVDIDLTTRPFPGLVLTAAGTYVKTRVDVDFAGTTSLGANANFKGAAFPNIPKFQGSATAEYAWTVGSGLRASVGGRVTHQSGSYGDFVKEPLLRIEPFTTVDAHVGLDSEDGKWSGQIWGRNLTNKYYWTTQQIFLDAVVRYAAMPVTYGVSLSYRY